MTGYVYVVQFDDGAIKVGRSDNPEGRIDRHRVESAKYGRYVTAFWSSEGCDSVRTEYEITKFCTENGRLRPGTREYYTGLSFAQCVFAAETLAKVSWADSRPLQDRDRSRSGKHKKKRPEVDQGPSLKAVLDCLTDETKSVHDLVEETGLSRATTYRQLRILLGIGAIESESGRWRLSEADV